MQQLLIPDRINVGFQKRHDTYTGQLAYVIYYDQKGVLRKEKSWQTWRDEKIDPAEYKNEPTEGFVLNKGVGGARQSYGWNTRNEYIRVYDPRNFEFEISVANLLFILRECDCSKGKGLEGKFVYAWEGTELVLLPVISQDYQNSKNYTALQTQSVKSKDLVPGATYQTKKQQMLVFLGRFDWHFMLKPSWRNYNATEYDKKDLAAAGIVKKYIFWDEKVAIAAAQYKANQAKLKQKAEAKQQAAIAAGEQVLALHYYYDYDEDEEGDYEDYYDENADSGFIVMDTPKTIAAIHSDVTVPNFAELVDRYHKSEHGSKVVSFFLKEEEFYQDDYNSRGHANPVWTFESEPGIFIEVQNCYAYNHGNATTKIENLSYRHKYLIKDGVPFMEHHGGVAHPPGVKLPTRNYYGRDDIVREWVEPTKNRLYAKLESGVEIKVDSGTFDRNR